VSLSEPEVTAGAPIEPTVDGRGAAFFDLDKTLMQGSSAFQFARAARAAGLISRRQLVGDAAANLTFRLRGATDQETSELRDRLAASIQGRRVKDFERLGLPVLIRVLPRIYPQMLEIAHAHQDAGRDVYIITAASEELAAVLAQVLALDGGIGSHFSDQVDGIYTGRSDGPFVYGEQKATEVRRLAAEHGYDLSACFAYSDSASDIPMLSAVGHAVVVNPDQALRDLAKVNGWATMALDPLGRRLKLAAALALTAAVGGAGGALWPLVLRSQVGPRVRDVIQHTHVPQLSGAFIPYHRQSMKPDRTLCLRRASHPTD
jgi:HAD superfamily hydrolase (TIGR01490 family)